MIQVFIKRTFRGLVLAFVAVNLVFFVVNIIGDPVGRSLPLDASPEQYAARARSLGFDRPLWEQYADYMGDVARLDFGDSISTQAPAMESVLTRFPRTFLLVGVGMGLTALIGIPIGVILATTKRKWVDRLGNSLTLTALSIPQFWLGILLILVFSLQLGWFPTSGIGSWKHVVLPSLALAIGPLGKTIQIIQVTLRDELQKPYIRTARAKGLSEGRVLYHALRNAVVAVATVFSHETILALAGYAVLVETVFAWPGIGSLIAEAISALDVPLTSAVVVAVLVVVVVANTLVDIMYRQLDPRIARGLK